jgi:molecular chaperone GrpE
MIHEALTHSYSDQVSEPTCVQILQPGYKVGDRILRPARVAVAEPDIGGRDEKEDDEPGVAAGQVPDDRATRDGTSSHGATADGDG